MRHFLLTLLCLLTALQAQAVIAEGDGWSLSDDGVLTVEKDFATRTPWAHYTIKEAVFLEGVTRIGNCAFEGESGLTNIMIPSGVTRIGSGAFRDCSGLKSVTIPNSVTCIESAFIGCSGLESFKVEEGNSTYDSRNDCNAIIETSTNTLVAGCKNTTIPSDVTSIGDYAFTDCSYLTSVTIPSSVTYIGKGAFHGCHGLTNIMIPSSVTRIGGSVFCDCSGLESIKVEDGNSTYDSRNDCNAIIETSTNTLVAGCKNTAIPSSVIWIRDEAFYGCSGLTSVTIPSKVTYIGKWAFRGCSGLTSVTLPGSLTIIGERVFEFCHGLTSIISLIPGERLYKTLLGVSRITIYIPEGTTADYVDGDRLTPMLRCPPGRLRTSLALRTTNQSSKRFTT